MSPRIGDGDLAKSWGEKRQVWCKDRFACGAISWAWRMWFWRMRRALWVRLDHDRGRETLETVVRSLKVYCKGPTTLYYCRRSRYFILFLWGELFQHSCLQCISEYCILRLCDCVIVFCDCDLVSDNVERSYGIIWGWLVINERLKLVNIKKGRSRTGIKF